MIRSIRNLFEVQEFVIDEKPMALLEMDQLMPGHLHRAAAKPARGEATEGESAEESESAEAGAEGKVTEQDLLTQMAELLIEQVRLADKARRLESKGAGDDEFGRFVRQALPFLDNFYRLLELARENPPSEEVTNWLKSVEALYFRIVNLLESYGLVFVNAAGKKVDLNIHEVVEYRPSTEHPHDTVIKELQKGVVFRGRLLRDAKVVVAYNQ